MTIHGALKTFIDAWGNYTDSTNVLLLMGTLLDLLPKITAIIALIYWFIRIYESDTVQWLIFKWKHREKHKD